MKLLVTGGAGFIGSNFIFYMRQAHPEDELVCADVLTYAGNYQTLKRAGGAVKFFRTDISDNTAVDNLFEEERFDAVVNFAAESHVDRSINNPEIFIKTNILGTQVLMEACRRFKVGRFHQISTDEVYGDLPLDRPDLAFDENSTVRPSSPYSASKAAADLLVLSYFRTYGLFVTISRCSNNYGPFQYPEKLIPLTIIKALQREKIPVYGSGLNRRDWLHAEDHCVAIDLIIRKGGAGEIYNVGSRSERTNLDVVRTILSILEQPETLITFVPDRPGHDLRYAVDTQKIQSALGWEPKTDFDSGLRKTVEWYLQNRSWWECILSSQNRNSDMPRLDGEAHLKLV